jgi:cysteine desulfurase/selenocysteine lyase
VVVSALEHHANLLPWQAACHARGARLVVAPAPGGHFDAESFAAYLGARTRVVALAALTNAFGTPLPVAELARRARAAAPDVTVVVDGAQAVAHGPSRPAAEGADFFVFSAHKLGGPGGIGALWGRRARLATLPPWLLGGGMVATVDEAGYTAVDGPARLEAGSPPGALAAGFAAALDFIGAIGWEKLAAHETSLVAAAAGALAGVPGVRLLGGNTRRAMVGFVVDGVHAHDVASFCDAAGVAVRAGHHCAILAHRAAGLRASVRASVGVHTTASDVERLVAAVAQASAALAPSRRRAIPLEDAARDDQT